MTVIRDLVRLGLAALAGVVVVVGYATYRIWEQGGRDEQRPVGAIVVLGAAQYDGRPSPVLRARLDHAVDLYRQGIAPVLVVTGGKQAGDRTTEAAVARRYAVGAGVPDNAIVVEDRGRTTLESVTTVGHLLRERDIHDAVFVSDPPHMLRVLRMARDEGLEAYGSPTRTGPVERSLGRRIDATIHELGALGLYFVAGGAPTDELGRGLEDVVTEPSPGPSSSP